MRAYEINLLNEGITNNEPISELNIACNLIQQNCEQILNAIRITKLLLYRGIGVSKYMPHPAFISNPSSNRATKSSSEQMQVFVDKALQQRGFKALRSNSIFCTTDIDLASDFGILFAIFPFDNFNFTWSPTVRDIILPDLLMGKELSHETERSPLLQIIIEYTKEIFKAMQNPTAYAGKLSGEIYDLLNNLKRYNDTDFYSYSYSNDITEDKIIEIFHLVINIYSASIRNNKVKNIFTNEQWKNIRNILDQKIVIKKKIKPVINNLVNFYGFENTNIGAAMKSKNEIAINSKYIAVQIKNSDIFNSLLENLGISKLQNRPSDDIFNIGDYKKLNQNQ